MLRIRLPFFSAFAAARYIFEPAKLGKGRN